MTRKVIDKQEDVIVWSLISCKTRSTLKDAPAPSC